MDIKHARRIIVIGAPESGALDMIEDLTASAPPRNEDGSTAGLAHEWHVETAYYHAKVPIWVDEITKPEEWKSDFLRPEGKEVVQALGAWIYCFRASDGDGPSKEVRQVMKAVQEISEKHAGEGADSVMLAVSMPSTQVSSNSGDEGTKEAWEDACLEYGFEYINFSAIGTNEFGEKMGFERLREALEANDWADAAHEDDDSEPDFEHLHLDDDDAFTRRDEAEMTAELFGVKAALAGAGDFQPEAEDFIPPEKQDKQVEDLDRMMGKLLAVKEQSADLPEAQRKRMAAQAVKELMA